MSGRRNPFEGLEELFERMSRQFENASRTWETEDESMPTGRDVFGTSMGGSGTGLDLADEGDEFVVTVDVPGYERDDVEIRLVGETLHLEGERGEERDEEAENYIRRERRSHSFSRRVRLPESVDVDGVSATLNNGVLTVTLPKEFQGEDSHSIDIE